MKMNPRTSSGKRLRGPAMGQLDWPRKPDWIKRCPTPEPSQGPKNSRPKKLTDQVNFSSNEYDDKEDEECRSTVYFKWVGAPDTRAETLLPFSTSPTHQFSFYSLVLLATYYFRSNIHISVFILMLFHGEGGAVKGRKDVEGQLFQLSSSVPLSSLRLPQSSLMRLPSSIASPRSFLALGGPFFVPLASSKFLAPGPPIGLSAAAVQPSSSVPFSSLGLPQYSLMRLPSSLALLATPNALFRLLFVSPPKSKSLAPLIPLSPLLSSVALRPVSFTLQRTTPPPVVPHAKRGEVRLLGETQVIAVISPCLSRVSGSWVARQTLVDADAHT